MAKLTKLPGRNIIDGFKGFVDFYVWNGIPCARSWPRSPGHDRAPAVEAQWLAWTWATSSWKFLSQEVQDAYRAMAAGSHCSGRDLYTRSVLNAQSLVLEDI